MIDNGKFRSSFKGLGERHENHLKLGVAEPESIRESTAESFSQRFETCCDCLWNVQQELPFYEGCLERVPR